MSGSTERPPPRSPQRALQTVCIIASSVRECVLFLVSIPLSFVILGLGAVAYLLVLHTLHISIYVLFVVFLVWLWGHIVCKALYTCVLIFRPSGSRAFDEIDDLFSIIIAPAIASITGALLAFWLDRFFLVFGGGLAAALVLSYLNILVRRIWEQKQ
jgi:hypothetical protein